VLAAVFCVLGVLPLIVLTQLGIIVGLGLVLDTFLVRTVIIPALFTAIGPKVWWPAFGSAGHGSVCGAHAGRHRAGTSAPADRR
jgi:putative drug exporter of the RND superfamily